MEGEADRLFVFFFFLNIIEYHKYSYYAILEKLLEWQKGHATHGMELANTLIANP